MEEKKLTKADLDKVRNMEGFPKGKDEDIIGLSHVPYYAACPNPFINDFIDLNGKIYDESIDTYQKEPFAADVVEGKNDPIYMAHSYHTKVPYKAIMKYILHYTEPGDIVFDGFCGTGMTGVAANMCGTNDSHIKAEFRTMGKGVKWGRRKAVLCDLSPFACFISFNYNHKVDCNLLENDINDLLKKCKNKIGYFYNTKNLFLQNEDHSLGKNATGNIDYTVWSEVFICPNCGKENIYYDLVVDSNKNSKSKVYTCKHCKGEFKKSEFQRAEETYFDLINMHTSKRIKRVPVIINYTYKGSKYKKEPDECDIQLLENIKNNGIPYWFPKDRMLKGTESRRNDKSGITHIPHFFTDRNLYVLSMLFAESEKYKTKELIRGIILSCMARASLRNRFMPEYGNRHVGTLSGTLYIPPLIEENNIFDAFKLRAKKVIKAYKLLTNSDDNYIISCCSITNTSIKNDCIDYIFVDPPFGDNLNYSELNFINEGWLRVYTNQDKEAIISKGQNKTLLEYQNLMNESFKECFRILKPNRWITVEFHNSQNAVWNCIQTTLQAAGFVIADVRLLDKKKGTTKQLSYASAVKQDLIISAYKPKDNLIKELKMDAGHSSTAWSFVRNHLSKLPVIVLKNNKMEVIVERQAYLLYDRMVAYHVMNGISIPLNSTEFYEGLDKRFAKRDDMYFLSDQVNEYDKTRLKNDIESLEFNLFVTNEKSAISWLYQQLSAKPQTYSELQPKFMQEIKTIDKYEDLPELSILLEENFIQNNAEQWYVPDITKKGDIEKLKMKRLSKEFEVYLNTKGKIKLFRIEVMHVGFAKLWADKNYKLIVETAERLPEQVIQEDDKLLMYYDLSLGRI